MALKFGASGLRRLVTELTPASISDYVRAFLSACPHGGTLYVGWDLRPSSLDIVWEVMATARAEGVAVVSAGMLRTPASHTAVTSLKQAMTVIASWPVRKTLRKSERKKRH